MQLSCYLNLRAQESCQRQAGFKFGVSDKFAFMNTDQIIILFIGFLFLVGGVGLLFVRVDKGAEERDRKRGWLVPDLPRNNIFSPYFFFQVRWYRWFVAGLALLLAAIFIAHAFGLFDRFIY
jgi:hypothetical protein